MIKTTIYMKHLKTFEQLKKDKRIIYHFTESIDSLTYILADDRLISGIHRASRHGLGYENISFTWNPALWDIEYMGDTHDRWKVRISLDYNKMKEKWDFKPFDYGIDEEQEEIVETDEMDEIRDYILEIQISSQESKSEIQYLKNKYPYLKIKTVRRMSDEKKYGRNDY